MLKIQTFGTFDISWEGISIFHPIKSSAKFISILQFLLLNYNDTFPPDTIAEKIWPDSDYLNVHSTISTFISRINNIIYGDNTFSRDFSPYITIQNRKGSYKAVVDENCDFDLRTFDELQKFSLTSTDPTENEAILERLISLYKGDIFESVAEDGFCIPVRTLHRRFINESVNKLFSILSSKKEYSKIINLSSNILQYMPLDVNSGTHYVKALHAMDMSQEITRYYEQIATTSAGRRIVPSNDMKIVYLQAKLKLKMSANSDSGNKGSPPQVFDGNLWDAFYDMMQSFMAKKASDYSVGYLQLFQGNETDLKKALEILVDIVKTILRIEDSYCIFEPDTVICVLKDAKHSSLPLISSRILNRFNDRCKDDTELHINLKIAKSAS